MTSVPKNSRSGSQTRRASEQIKLNATKEQKEKVQELAAARGQSPAALALNALLGIPLPRSRRPKVDDKAMARYLAELAKVRDRLRTVEAELGKSGSNLNQIAHRLNAGRPTERMTGAIEAALADHQDALSGLAEAVRDLLEQRTLGMQALGLEKDPGSHDNEA